MMATLALQPQRSRRIVPVGATGGVGAGSLGEDGPLLALPGIRGGSCLLVTEGDHRSAMALIEMLSNA
jgi:hypothetical protein